MGELVKIKKTTVDETIEELRQKALKGEVKDLVVGFSSDEHMNYRTSGLSSVTKILGILEYVKFNILSNSVFGD